MVSSVSLALPQGGDFKREQESSLISKILRIVRIIFLTPFSCMRSQRKPDLKSDLRIQDLVQQESTARGHVENAYEESLISMKQAERESRTSAEQAAKKRAVEMFSAPTNAERARRHVLQWIDAEAEKQSPTPVKFSRTGSSPNVTAEQLLLEFMKNPKA